jgi:hypothetical protein
MSLEDEMDRYLKEYLLVLNKRRRGDDMSIDPKYDLPKTTSDRNTPIDYGVSKCLVETTVKPKIPGFKLDHLKPDLDLVLGDFSRALDAVGQVGTFGAAKYSRSGWLEVPNGLSRYKSALWRHLLADKKEEVDQESNLLHLAHAAWNALAILELVLRVSDTRCKKTSEFKS